MFEIIAALDKTNPRSIMNMLKYFYLSLRLGLKEFSSPSPKFVMSLMGGIVSHVGKLSVWDKLANKFQQKENK